MRTSTAANATQIEQGRIILLRQNQLEKHNADVTMMTEQRAAFKAAVEAQNALLDSSDGMHTSAVLSAWFGHNFCVLTRASRGYLGTGHASIAPEMGTAESVITTTQGAAGYSSSLYQEL